MAQHAAVNNGLSSGDLLRDRHGSGRGVRGGGLRRRVESPIRDEWLDAGVVLPMDVAGGDLHGPAPRQVPAHKRPDAPWAPHGAGGRRRRHDRAEVVAGETVTHQPASWSVEELHLVETSIRGGHLVVADPINICTGGFHCGVGDLDVTGSTLPAAVAAAEPVRGALAVAGAREGSGARALLVAGRPGPAVVTSALLGLPVAVSVVIAPAGNTRVGASR
mmetsp:Transcript_29139/g.93030  ORF Transcript_29139/g.93030 Transcript_29139/m.93030 type:complete len:219 (+) Transcript_29139:1471-2127(+)